MSCECVIPKGGKAVFCPRRKAHVTANMQRRCASSESECIAIDELFSPANAPLIPAVPGRHVTVRREKVGTELAKLIAWVATIKPDTATCDCKSLAKEMDKRGVDWCRTNRDGYIVPKLLKNREALSDELKAQKGWRGVLAKAAGILPESMLASGAALLVDRAIVNARSAATTKPTGRARGRRGRFSGAFVASGTPRFVTSAQLQRDILTLVSKLPHDITAVAGVARSGLSVATMVSMYLHLPMLTIRQTMNDVQQTGNGWRLGGKKHVNPKTDRILIVDDTVMTGNSLRAIEPLVESQFGECLTAAVYVNPKAIQKPDFHAVDLPWPHLLEWNLFNSVLSPNMATDFDGILCHDCPAGSDDDGPKYLEFIRHAQPLYMPRKEAIPLIVTARIEKYRGETLAWLNRWGIRCNRLIMHPAKTRKERQQDDIASYKARHFEAWAIRHKANPEPLGFIESDDRQARAIARHTGRIVICPSTAGVY